MQSIFNKIAQGISIVFHPIFMVTYGCLLLLTTFPFNLLVNTKFVVYFSIGTLLITAIFPILIFNMMRHLGKLESLRIRQREQRTIPYIVMLLSFICELLFVHYCRLDRLLLPEFIVGGLISIVCLLVINFFWKISAHMLGIGSILGLLFAFAYQFQINPVSGFVYLTLIAGLVGSARLQLKAHTPRQVYAGFFLGLLVTPLYYLIVI